MRELENKEWGEFMLGEIFDFVMRGKRLIERDRIKGNIPYYSASKENNGLSDMIGNPLFIQKDKLIVSTFCDCYFVEGEFTASDEITIFGNKKLNKYNALFIANIIKSQALKYAFGRKAFSERLIKQKIILPINSQNQPDFEFMESFMRELESKHLQKIIAYYQNKLLSSGGGEDYLIVILGRLLVLLSIAKYLSRHCEAKPKCLHEVLTHTCKSIILTEWIVAKILANCLAMTKWIILSPTNSSYLSLRIA